jgi:excisionase family DNA binding protein
MTVEMVQLHSREPMMTVLQAAAALGIGRTLAYELVRTGEWPTPVVRIGRLVRIPRRPFEQFLATGRSDASVA